MKDNVYSNLRKKIIALTLIVSFTPLLILGLTIYYQFEKLSREKTEGQIRYRAQAQAEAVDLFLKERTAILSAMADTHLFQEMTDEKRLSYIFEVMRNRAGAFVDLGVIDDKGDHLAYVGPYNLKGRNYFEQQWFAEVISKGVYISDVYMGFRKLPHFIIAVRRHENQKSWILRATIDPEVMGKIVRSAQIGKTGDAYLINRDGIYQTQPRFQGLILSKSDLDTNLFGGRVTVAELKKGKGESFLYAGSWLKDSKWLLIIQQNPSELMAEIFTMRYSETIIISLGLIAIILTTIFTTRLAIEQLKRSDKRINRLHAQLIQTDKLAALGKMAAGVAHEINNPLAVIIQKTGWMEDLLFEEDFQNSKNLEEFKISIRKIEEHVERARKVVHNMLGYARKMEPHLEDMDVNDTMNKTISLLENYSRTNNIEIQTDLSEDLPIIAGDQAQLQQVFLNLINNAIDAIGKNGLIEVKSRCKGSEIIVSIKDNGPGIPEEMQKKIFDPFFTTKETGKGTGLGLWVTFNIIEKMSGTIHVQSKADQGSTFIVKIPIVTPEKK
ncbi:MAG: ATP-binding protein [Desulfobacterales bacterium]